MTVGTHESESSKKEHTLTVGEANIKSVFFIIPIAALYSGLYVLVWGWSKFNHDLIILSHNYLAGIGLIVLGMILHEGLHALVWSQAAKLPWSAFSFGFNIKGLALYTHCTRPMSISAYRLGCVAPGLVLGVIPFIWGLYIGNGEWMGFGFLFTLVAAGDFLMFWIACQIPAGTMVQDHPQKVGFEIHS